MTDPRVPPDPRAPRSRPPRLLDDGRAPPPSTASSRVRVPRPPRARDPRPVPPRGRLRRGVDGNLSRRFCLRLAEEAERVEYGLLDVGARGNRTYAFLAELVDGVRWTAKAIHALLHLRGRIRRYLGDRADLIAFRRDLDACVSWLGGRLDALLAAAREDAGGPLGLAFPKDAVRRGPPAGEEVRWRLPQDVDARSPSTSASASPTSRRRSWRCATVPSPMPTIRRPRARSRRVRARSGPPPRRRRACGCTRSSPRTTRRSRRRPSSPPTRAQGLPRLRQHPAAPPRGRRVHAPAPRPARGRRALRARARAHRAPRRAGRLLGWAVRFGLANTVAVRPGGARATAADPRSLHAVHELLSTCRRGRSSTCGPRASSCASCCTTGARADAHGRPGGGRASIDGRDPPRRQPPDGDAGRLPGRRATPGRPPALVPAPTGRGGLRALPSRRSGTCVLPSPRSAASRKFRGSGPAAVAGSSRPRPRRASPGRPPTPRQTLDGPRARPAPPPPALSNLGALPCPRPPPASPSTRPRSPRLDAHRRRRTGRALRHPRRSVEDRHDVVARSASSTTCTRAGPRLPAARDRGGRRRARGARAGARRRRRLARPPARPCLSDADAAGLSRGDGPGRGRGPPRRLRVPRLGPAAAGQSSACAPRARARPARSLSSGQRGAKRARRGARRAPSRYDGGRAAWETRPGAPRPAAALPEPQSARRRREAFSGRSGAVRRGSRGGPPCGCERPRRRCRTPRGGP